MSEEKYEGKWKIPGVKNTQEGILFVDRENGMIRLKVFLMGNQGLDFGSNVKTVSPIITGSLLGNYKITLVNNTIIHRHEHLGSYTELLFEVKWAIWGAYFDGPDEINSKKYSLNVDGILNWSNLCRFSIDFDNKFEWVKKDSIEIELKEGLTITFYPANSGVTMLALIEKEFKFEQYIEIVFNYSSEASLDTFWKDYGQLEKLITIGARNIPLVRNINYFDTKNTTFGERIKPNKIYVAEKPHSNGEETSKFHMLYCLEDLVSDEKQPVKKWNEIAEKILPALNLYFSIIRYEDLPIEMRYLNIVQALETYHSRFKYNDLIKYKKHVLTLFKCNELDEIPQKEREAYFDSTQSDENISYIILKSRLVDLMNDDFCLELEDLFCEGSKIEKYEFIQKVVDTRHYFTHYGKSKEGKAFTGLDLEYAIRILMYVFEYHFMKELDFCYSVIKQKIQHQYSNLNKIYLQRFNKSSI